MNILIIDTETTGLPLYDENQLAYHEELNYYNPARILQISWMIVNAKDTLVSVTDLIIANNYDV